MTKSYAGLIIGFGIFGGIGMGIGYAAPTPAALKWFGPHKRGLIAGLVVGGYGGAALYISPLAAYLLATGGITYSFVFWESSLPWWSSSPAASWPGRLRAMWLRRPGESGVAPAKAAGTLVTGTPAK